MADKTLTNLDATAQAELVRKREVSPTQLVNLAIEAIEALNPRLNAVIHRHFERARNEAAGRLPEGPFRGVPFLLKDLACGNLKGDPIHWGTRFLRDAKFVAPTTSYLVEKFRQAGLVVVGRTNVPELGAWTTTEPQAYGATHNPWNLDHSSGGSSGGSAAAVASHIVPMAHASDGGGSIRIPASECGLVGLKPSRGRISVGPDIAEAWEGMAFEFALTRTVRDAAALLDAVAGAMPGDPYGGAPPERPYREEVGRSPGRLRVGIVTHLADVAIHLDCAAAVEAAGRILERLGHRVEASFPDALISAELGAARPPQGQTGYEEDQLGIIPVIAASQARGIELFGKAIGRTLGPSDMDVDNWAVTELGQKITATQYLASVEALNRISRRMAQWWTSGFDLLITPTIPEPPPPLGELVPDPREPLKGFIRSGALVRFTIPFNVTGQPAISLPLHWNSAGLPIGVQIVAAFGREDQLIQIASQLEEAMPWRDRKPLVCA